MSHQAGFLLQTQVIPRLQSAIPNVVHCVGSENAQELIQDSIAMAAKMMDGAEQAGKKVRHPNEGKSHRTHMKTTETTEEVSFHPGAKGRWSPKRHRNTPCAREKPGMD